MNYALATPLKDETGADANALRRVNVLGVGVSVINMAAALEAIEVWIAARDTTRYVCVTGVHGVMECQRDDPLRRIHNAAALVTPDGMPLVWLSKWHGFVSADRVYGPDLMLALCAHGLARGYRHFFYGGAPGVVEKLVKRLSESFPGLHIVGAITPPFSNLPPAQDAEVIGQINDVRPDIVWVGLSTPKQERWMADHASRLNAPVLIGVGAAFDFNAGTKRQAPRWIQRSGLEWLFRLLSEPRRLGKRYLLNNPAFIILTVLQITGLRRWEL